MSLSTVSVILVEPVAVFELSVAAEVFGHDRTDDGVPRFDLRTCSSTPGVPMTTDSGGAVAVTASHGLDAVPGSDLVIVSATAIDRRRTTRRRCWTCSAPPQPPAPPC